MILVLQNRTPRTAEDEECCFGDFAVAASQPDGWWQDEALSGRDTVSVGSSSQADYLMRNAAMDDSIGGS